MENIKIVADEETKKSLGVSNVTITEAEAQALALKANATGTMQATIKEGTLDVNRLLID